MKKILWTVLFLLLTHVYADCGSQNSWSELKPEKRSLDNRLTHLTVIQACKKYDHTNLLNPEVICSVNCSHHDGSTHIFLHTLITEKEKMRNQSFKEVLTHCVTNTCFIESCRHYFLQYNMKQHCAALYTKSN